MSFSTRKSSTSLPLIFAGALSSAALALGMTPTLSSFTAAIAGAVNVAGAGTLVMEESTGSGVATCVSSESGVALNTATCSSINKYGGDTGLPGGSGTTTVVNIKNLGSIAASAFALTPGPCAQTAGSVSGTANDMCSKVLITVVSGTTTIFRGSAQAFGDAGAIDIRTKMAVGPVQPGARMTFSITAALDASAGNDYQGLRITQPLTWTFGS